jgi:chromate transporter
MTATLLALAAMFGELSLLAFGGGNTIIPEMQRQVVDVHHWMSAADFSALFALSRAAPGPNLMIVTLLGWRVAGWQGALVATVCQLTPSALLTGVAAAMWQRFRQSPWRRLLQGGLVPVTIGLVGASAALVAEGADTSWSLAALTAAVALATATTRWHPLWLLALGAIIGGAGTFIAGG